MVAVSKNNNRAGFLDGHRRYISIVPALFVRSEFSRNAKPLLSLQCKNGSSSLSDLQ